MCTYKLLMFNFTFFRCLHVVKQSIGCFTVDGRFHRIINVDDCLYFIYLYSSSRVTKLCIGVWAITLSRIQLGSVQIV